jgi:hypothetical protein
LNCLYVTVRGRFSMPVPPRSVSRLIVIVPLCSGGACGYGDFEATTARGLRPLLAILAAVRFLRRSALGRTRGSASTALLTNARSWSSSTLSSSRFESHNLHERCN